jgi:hypothetical protein
MKNKNHHSVKTVPKITTPSKLFQKSPLRQNCSKNHHSVKTVKKITGDFWNSSDGVVIFGTVLTEW